MKRWESDPRVISLREKFGARIVVSVDMKNEVINHYGPLFNPDAEPEQIQPSSFDFDIQAIESELESGPCQKILICGCGRKYGKCSEVEQILIEKEKENNYMINYTSNNSPNATKTRPDSRGIPFLKVDDLGPKPLTTEIMGAKIGPDTFKDTSGEVVTVKVKIGDSVIRLWTLRSNNPNLGTLCDGLGKDETKWKGNIIELFTEKDEFDEKLWIRSSVVKGRK